MHLDSRGSRRIASARRLQAIEPNMTEDETAQELVRAAREVTDPETGLNVVDMGLIFQVDYSAPLRRAHVVMTFTTPSLPIGRRDG